MSVLCAFVAIPDGGGVCGRKMHQWTPEMHPVCPRHDRLACPKCHVPIIDGHAVRCPGCQADVRLQRKEPG
jgi:hypothetical protein